MKTTHNRPVGNAECRCRFVVGQAHDVDDRDDAREFRRQALQREVDVTVEDRAGTVSSFRARRLRSDGFGDRSVSLRYRESGPQAKTNLRYSNVRGASRYAPRGAEKRPHRTRRDPCGSRRTRRRRTDQVAPQSASHRSPARARCRSRQSATTVSHAPANIRRRLESNSPKNICRHRADGPAPRQPIIQAAGTMAAHVPTTRYAPMTSLGRCQPAVSVPPPISAAIRNTKQSRHDPQPGRNHQHQTEQQTYATVAWPLGKLGVDAAPTRCSRSGRLNASDFNTCVVIFAPPTIMPTPIARRGRRLPKAKTSRRPRPAKTSEVTLIVSSTCSVTARTAACVVRPTERRFIRSLTRMRTYCANVQRRRQHQTGDTQSSDTKCTPRAHRNRPTRGHLA